MSSHFTLPLYIDLSATCLYAMTGALLAIRRHYDVIGMFVLALVSGVGGGLIRDGIFIQKTGRLLRLAMGVILLLLFSAVLPRLCFSITSLVCKLPFCMPMRLGWVVTRSLGLSTRSTPGSRL